LLEIIEIFFPYFREFPHRGKNIGFYSFENAPLHWELNSRRWVAAQALYALIHGIQR
jgi:hypothetical protein